MGHTKEPWEIYKDDRGLGHASYLIWGDETPIADMCGDATLPNAERIVTCVNACEGLSNDEVKRYGPEIKEMVELLKDVAEFDPMSPEVFHGQ